VRRNIPVFFLALPCVEVHRGTVIYLDIRGNEIYVDYDSIIISNVLTIASTRRLRSI